MERCLRCGYTFDTHKPNLVNEPGEGFPWIDEIAHGFTMTILECMESPYPSEYLALLEDNEDEIAGWPGWDRFNCGYVSPDPIAEAEEYSLSLAVVSDHILLMAPDGRAYDIGS